MLRLVWGSGEMRVATGRRRFVLAGGGGTFKLDGVGADEQGTAQWLTCQVSVLVVARHEPTHQGPRRTTGHRRQNAGSHKLLITMPG